MLMDQKRSSFAVTCNLLNQYLKEKKCGISGGGSLGNNFSFGRVPSSSSSSPAADSDGKGKPKPPPTTNLLSGVDKSGQPKSSRTAQMTIFYAGKVIVIDNLPEEKAMGLVAVAGKPVSSAEAVTDFTTVDKPKKAQPHLTTTTTTTTSTTDVSDLPIARRASLGRFLEKRKDRASSEAPYRQVNPPPSSSTGGPANPKTTKKKAPEWLSLAPNSAALNK